MKKLLIIGLWGITSLSFAQDRHFTAVNPALFSYPTTDVYINPPQKYNNGSHLLSPNPQQYPWEERLENGMPNVMVDSYGNTSVYFSSFLIFSPTPPSRVGVMAFSNISSDQNQWGRPNVGLYWYNAAGTTADEKITPTYAPGYQSTNIVAVDIESLGIYDDGSGAKPVKLIYMPQREFQYKYLGVYEMGRDYTAEGVLSGFRVMATDRKEEQKVLTFKNINADTHMNWMKHNGKFFFTSRVNSRRSALKSGEVPPFTVDPRKRFRRNTITEIGTTLESENVDYNVVLDYSTKQWEPYSMQPFRMKGFEKDVWLGLVTMYGVEGNPGIEKRQRTELAISSNGKDWRYLKPGIPFLDNGTDPQADDHGCINIATPVYNTKLHGIRNPNDPFFYYASSRIGHEEGRNPGISLAMSKYGKLAGIQSTALKIYYSVTPVSCSGLSTTEMPKLSVKNSFAIDAKFYPHILGDITDDPRGKVLSQLNSYVLVRMFAYDSTKAHGLGSQLGATFGSSIKGTHTISDDYEAVDAIFSGVKGISKEGILRYLKSCSDKEPTKIISFKDLPEVPIVFETRVKNAVFYGIKFEEAENHTVSVNVDATNEFAPTGIWSFKPPTPIMQQCYIEDFSTINNTPNRVIPTQMESGTIAIKINPNAASDTQTMLKMYGDSENYISLDYLSNGSLRYNLVKEGTNYLNMQIAPPSGASFNGKDVILTIEAVKNANRKYNKVYKEETTIMRVKCAALNYEKILPQDVIWNFRRETPTPVDSAYARGYAYLPFSAFVGNMTRIEVGGSSETCDHKFTGSIYQVEVAPKLPTGDSDFWSTVNSEAVIFSEKQERRKAK